MQSQVAAIVWKVYSHTRKHNCEATEAVRPTRTALTLFPLRSLQYRPICFTVAANLWQRYSRLLLKIWRAVPSGKLVDLPVTDIANTVYSLIQIWLRSSWSLLSITAVDSQSAKNLLSLGGKIAAILDVIEYFFPRRVFLYFCYCVFFCVSQLVCECMCVIARLRAAIQLIIGTWLFN